MREFELEGELQDIDISEFGKVMPAKHDRVALIDADTLAWTSALAAQQEMHVLPDSMYSDIERDAIRNNPTFDEESMTYSVIDLDLAMQYAKEKLQRIYDLTGCQKCELHFSGGKENFRYMIFPDYKANRKGMKVPDGLYDLKVKLCEEFNGTIHTKWEADDVVVLIKKNCPESFLLCAVDKDVLNSVEGEHFNYYESGAFNKDMHFITTSEGTARMWPYLQCIMGDSSDGIEGVKGIGPKKALNFVNESMTHLELWQGVLSAYRSKGYDDTIAKLNMRLVNMHQLDINDELEIIVSLWDEPNE